MYFTHIIRMFEEMLMRLRFLLVLIIINVFIINSTIQAEELDNKSGENETVVTLMGHGLDDAYAYDIGIGYKTDKVTFRRAEFGDNSQSGFGFPKLVDGVLRIVYTSTGDQPIMQEDSVLCNLFFTGADGMDEHIIINEIQIVKKDSANRMTKEIIVLDKEVSLSLTRSDESGLLVDASGAVTITDQSIAEASVGILITTSVDMRISFTDIPAGYWGLDYIKLLVSKGILNGKSSTVFDPEGQVTRAEFIKMLVLAEGKDSKGNGLGFHDVSEEDWYYDYIMLGTENAYVSGYPDGTFRPDEYISRQDIALIISRAVEGDKLDSISLPFSDSELISDYSLSGVKKAYGLGIIHGKPDNEFDPKGLATRSEAAAIIYRYLGIK